MVLKRNEDDTVYRPIFRQSHKSRVKICLSDCTSPAYHLAWLWGGQGRVWYGCLQENKWYSRKGDQRSACIQGMVSLWSTILVGWLPFEKQWYTAFPQIVSRIGHTNPDVFSHLSKLIIRVMEEYPKQALWLFTSVAKSTKSNREQRGRTILDQLRVGEFFSSSLKSGLNIISY